MNIALPAITIILGLLPGIVFFESYFSGRFTKQAAAISGVSELALYVLFAVPLNGIALAITHARGSDLDFNVVAGALLGSDQSGQLRKTLADGFIENWRLTIQTYMSVLVAAFLAGSMLRKVVWAFRLDVHFPLLRMKHDWYYILQGRLKGVERNAWAIVDVLIEHPGTTQLYRGIVSGFQVNRDGGIKQLILRAAERDQVGQPITAGTVSRWKPIPGDKFIIMGSAIRSINLRHTVMPEVVPVKKPSKWRRAGATMGRWFRLFWFETQ